MVKLLIKIHLCYRCILVQLSNILKDKLNSDTRVTINFNLE